jgi:hypothetical protein
MRRRPLVDIRITSIFKNFLVGGLACIAFVLAGCHRPDPHPELSDPIYMDLKAEQQQIEKNLASNGEALEKAKALYRKSPQYSQPRFDGQEKWISAVKEQLDLTQKLLIVRKNLANRRTLVLKSYEKAFEEGKSWPPKEEYEAYKALNHMRNLAAEPEQTKEARKIAQEESHTKKKPAAAPAPAQHH